MLPSQRVAPVSGPTLLRGGSVWNGSDADQLVRSDILIQNGVILEVGPSGSVDAPAGARRLDADGKFVIPGLVDMHIHLVPGNSTELCVAAGVTTVRDLGNYSEWVFGLREKIHRGELPGPRIYAVGEIIEGRIPCRRGFVRVTTPEDARVAVRALLDRGADGIKLYQSTPADIVSAAVDEAHRLGSWIAGHLCCMNFINAWYSVENVGAEYRGHRDCHGALEAGVSAGIDTLEHAFATSDSVLDQMVENKVAFCPTLACSGSQGGYRDLSLLPRFGAGVRRPSRGLRAPAEHRAERTARRALVRVAETARKRVSPRRRQSARRHRQPVWRGGRVRTASGAGAACRVRTYPARNAARGHAARCRNAAGGPSSRNDRGRQGGGPRRSDRQPAGRHRQHTQDRYRHPGRPNLRRREAKCAGGIQGTLRPKTSTRQPKRHASRLRGAWRRTRAGCPRRRTRRVGDRGGPPGWRGRLVFAFRAVARQPDVVRRPGRNRVIPAHGAAQSR